MNVLQVANGLSGFGFTTKSVKEPSATEDGIVEVSEQVHVQVPFDGQDLNVVAVIDGRYEFYDLQRKLSRVVRDIRLALARVHLDVLIDA